MGDGFRSGVPANGSQRVQVLDATTGQRQQMLTGFKDNIYDIGISPDGKTLTIACFDGTLSFYHKQGNDWALTYRRDTPNSAPTALAAGIAKPARPEANTSLIA